MHSPQPPICRLALLGLILAASTLTLSPTALADPSTATPPSAGPLSPQHDAAVARLTLVLSHVHHVPSEASLRALEPSLNVPATMQRLIQDPDADGITRSNAIYALRFYPSDDTRRFAAALLRAQVERDDDLERHHMGRTIRLIGQDLSADDPNWAIDTLATVVDHPDFGIREEVIAGLLIIRANDTARPRVDDLLIQRVLAERHPTVRKRLREGLEGVDALTPQSTPAPIYRQP